MTEQQTATVHNTHNNLSPEVSQFLAESPKTQLELIPQLVSSGDSGWEVLMTFLQLSQTKTPNIVIGKAYQALYQVNVPKTLDFLTHHFPNGVIPLKSERNIDYQGLNELLLKQEFQAADTLTRQKLCELAGEAAVQRKWAYFTEVEQFPSTDLHTINSLWWVYSEGKFGFSVQRKIWLSVGQDYNKLWPKIGWKQDNNWTQYPNQFTWDLSAPVGHLPLLNQLRGVRVAASLFSHPVWSEHNW
ncbi:GUN4 domain protein [Rippkaea orientalis PCC 8801]|uniref:GUN4 domain protein n=1 Tax=Rippkaea orientalis (strain PCC 8801 / RF-1) TaxID=41431 RepID=B7K4R0_RIPO1|nr:GUN4 domain-containing protein [Rippkaea orientalis]ACK66566.1 GUN4 domain protein [Rippkaea orientalis PCC 8801]